LYVTVACCRVWTKPPANFVQAISQQTSHAILADSAVLHKPTRCNMPKACPRL